MHHHHLDSRWCIAKADGVERLRYSHMTIICLHALPMASPLHVVFLWYRLCTPLALLCPKDHSLVVYVLHFAWCTMHVMVSWNMGYIYPVNSTQVWAPASTASSRKRERKSAVGHKDIEQCGIRLPKRRIIHLLHGWIKIKHPFVCSRTVKNQLPRCLLWKVVIV
jgi:hypothetical protein